MDALQVIHEVRQVIHEVLQEVFQEMMKGWRGVEGREIWLRMAER